MKKFSLFISLIILLSVASGCAQFSPKSFFSAQPEAMPLPNYSGKKAKLMVTDFEVKAAKAGGDIGLGLREMLVSALANSGRYSVTAPKGQGADLILTAAVVEFEPEFSGGRSGVGGGGGSTSGVLGGLLGASLNKAHMTLEIRIIDATTSEVLASTRVQGSASDVSGMVLAGSFSNWALGPGLSGYANTPMEKAIRGCIIETVRYVSQTIPASYYKY